MDSSPASTRSGPPEVEDLPSSGQSTGVADDVASSGDSTILVDPPCE